MTEHIIQFGVGIDDDAIIQSVKDKAEHVILRDLEREILQHIFRSDYYGRPAIIIGSEKDMPEVTNTAQFTRIATDIIEETMKQYKDDIIKLAATMLADSYKRTKAWKEATNEVIGGEK